ncbi:MAG: hypothetical protein PHS07_02425 [Patescibacteria group bacterium]|nr:hypothetical protein [Patescibacteria group bacterium]
MKKIKTVLITLSFFAVSSLMFAQNALADLLPPPDGGWDTPSRPNINPEPKTFIDLIEPQHIVIGGAVLAVVIISFVVLFKMRKK